MEAQGALLFSGETSSGEDRAGTVFSAHAAAPPCVVVQSPPLTPLPVFGAGVDPEQGGVTVVYLRRTGLSQSETSTGSPPLPAQGQPLASPNFPTHYAASRKG